MPADNELAIVLKFVDQATQASTRWHSGERQRIKQTAREQIDADKDMQKSRENFVKALQDSARKTQQDQAKINQVALQSGRKHYQELAQAARNSAGSIADIMAKMEQQVTAAQAMSATEREKIEQVSVATRIAGEKQVFADFQKWQKQTRAEQQQTAQEMSRWIAQSRAERSAMARESTNRIREQTGEEQDSRKEFERSAETQKRAWRQSIQHHEVEDKARDKSRKKFDEWRKEHHAGTQEATDDLGGLVKTYVTLQAVQHVASLATATIQLMAESAAAARDYIKDIVQEAEHARTAAVEIAALEGKKATAGYTAEQARQAAEVGVSPEQYQQGKLSFQAFGGQYIGKEGATEAEQADEAKRGKISYEQAQELQTAAAKSAAAKGISQAETQKLMATVVAKRKPGASTEEMATQQEKLLQAMKLAPGYTGPLIGQLQEVVQESVGEGGEFKDAEEAAIMLRSISERNPQEASTYTRSLLRGLREIRMDENKMEETGITKDMDTFQAVEQMMKKADEYEASGEGTANEYLSKHFKDIREFGGIRTAISSGIKGGGFERTRAELAGVNAETGAGEHREYIKGEEGQTQKQQAELLAQQREQAGKYVELRKHEREAEKSVAMTQDHPEGLVEAFQTKTRQTFGYGDRKAQETREETARVLEQKLMGYEGGRKYLEKNYGQQQSDGQGGATPRLGGRYANEDALAEAASELKRLRILAEKDAARKGGGVPAAHPGAPPVQRR